MPCSKHCGKSWLCDGQKHEQYEINEILLSQDTF